MLQPATGSNRAGRIDRRITFFNRDDLPIRVDHECRAIRQVPRTQHAVQLHHVPFVIRQEREIGVQFFRPVVESRYEISADR